MGHTLAHFFGRAIFHSPSSMSLKLNLKKRASAKPMEAKDNDDGDELLQVGAGLVEYVVPKKATVPVAKPAPPPPPPPSVPASAPAPRNPLAAVKPKPAAEKVPRKKKAVVEEEEHSVAVDETSSVSHVTDFDEDDESSMGGLDDQFSTRLPMLKSDKDGVGELITMIFQQQAANASKEHAAVYEAIKKEEEHCYNGATLTKEEATTTYKNLKKRLRESSTMKLTPAAMDLLTAAANAVEQELIAELVPHGADQGRTHSVAKASELYIHSKAHEGVSPLRWSPAEQKFLSHLHTLEYAKNRIQKLIIEAGGKGDKDEVIAVREIISARISGALEEYHERGNQDSLGDASREKTAYADYEKSMGVAEGHPRAAQALAIFNMKTLAVSTTADLLHSRAKQHFKEEKRRETSKDKVARMEEGKQKKKREAAASAVSELSTGAEEEKTEAKRSRKNKGK